MNTVVDAFLLVYVGLFPVVNPVGNAPIFLALTANRSAAMQRVLAFRVALNGLFLLLGALFVGSHVLFFFGITVPVLRIAGGLAVAAFGWHVLNHGGASDHDVEASDTEGAVEAFYPLTLPLTVGPGSISVAIALGTPTTPNIRQFTGRFVSRGRCDSRSDSNLFDHFCLLPIC